MNLPDLKQLDKIIALCRKRGVSEITVDNMTVKLGDMPSKPGSKKSQASTGSEVMSGIAADFEADGLTQDQLLMWSSQQMTEETGDSQPQ